MAKNPKTLAELIGDPAALDAVQTGAPEVIDAEQDKYERMMNDIAGATDGEIILWLHRATEKNKALHGSFLKRYPKETKFIEIFEEARDVYGGGDFVLIAKKDDVMFRKAAFTCEKLVPPEKPAFVPPVDPFAQLAQALEKSLVVGKVTDAISANRAVPIPAGVDPVITLMMTMMNNAAENNRTQMSNVQEQNKILMTALVAGRKGNDGDNSTLLEAIKLGSAIAGGKVPLDEGEGGGGIMGILSELRPFVPQIIAMLSGKGPAVARPVMTRPGVVVPRPAPVHPGMISGPAAGVLPEEPATPVPPEDPAAVRLRRVVEEIRFILTLPVTPKLREHVIEYIEAYLPDILQQAEVASPEMFAAYVVTLDPAFSGQEAFFIDLHKQYMAGLEGEDTPPEKLHGMRTTDG